VSVVPAVPVVAADEIIITDQPKAICPKHLCPLDKCKYAVNPITCSFAAPYYAVKSGTLSKKCINLLCCPVGVGLSSICCISGTLCCFLDHCCNMFGNSNKCYFEIADLICSCTDPHKNEEIPCSDA
jgi:hypothetical protein